MPPYTPVEAIVVKFLLITMVSEPGRKPIGGDFLLESVAVNDSCASLAPLEAVSTVMMTVELAGYRVTKEEVTHPEVHVYETGENPALPLFEMAMFWVVAPFFIENTDVGALLRILAGIS